MNDIKELNERISQLTELVRTGSEAIKNMETALKAAKEERDRLADQRREQEPKFERTKSGKNYYKIGFTLGMAGVGQSCEMYAEIDNAHFNHNNYFKNPERAQEVADKINFLLKLERLHDTFCPDFNLGLGDGLDVEKYYVYYNFVHMKWMSSCMIHSSSAVQVYFPTREIAQKVCDILNMEHEDN